MTKRSQRIRQPVYEIWVIFQFLMKNKNRINWIFFSGTFLYFPKDFSDISCFCKIVIKVRIQWNPVWLSTNLWESIVSGGCSIWDFTGLLLQSGISRLTAPSLESPVETVIVTALSTVLIDSCRKQLYIFHSRGSGPLGPWFHSN